MSAPDGPSADKRKLSDLGRRLDDFERRAEATGTLPPKKRAEPNSALGSAFKLSTEFVAALAVGGGMGWVLDSWLDTKPALFLAFLALGVGAGFWGVFRAARSMQAADAEKAKTAPALPAGDEDED